MKIRVLKIILFNKRKTYIEILEVYSFKRNWDYYNNKMFFLK